MVDWLADFDYHIIHGNNMCPENSTCVTFEEQYGDGRGLCNAMWGDAFFYSEDETNCTVMAFDGSGPNPNYQLRFPVVVDTAESAGVHVVGEVMLLLIMTALASILIQHN